MLKKLGNAIFYLSLGLVAFLLLRILLPWPKRSVNSVVESSADREISTEATPIKPTSSPDPSGTGKIEKAEFPVHVTGQVNHPGIYIVEEGQVYADAVNRAGGLTEEACESAVNLAQTLEPNQQVYLPSQEEVEAGLLKGLSSDQQNPRDSQKTSSGLINLNTASLDDLMRLPGIGPTRARSIIDFREENGGYRSKEDLMLVPGIKEASFRKLEDKICVE